MMKILLVTRLYSGILNSVSEKKWDPSGVPAIINFINGLKKKQIEFDYVFLMKNSHKSMKQHSFQFPQFKGSQFHVFLWKNYLRNQTFVLLRIFNHLINDLIQLLQVCKIIKAKQYDVLYFDRSNILIAAVFSLLGYKVIMRYLGVASMYENACSLKYRFLHFFDYLSLFAPFSYIICTKDGSPARALLEKYRNKNSPYEILHNGCDFTHYNVNDDILNLEHLKTYPIILFSGRLVKDKGVDFFLKALEFLKSKTDQFYALIIGSGELFDQSKKEIERLKLEQNVFILGSVPLNKMNDYCCLSDIYVSINFYGALSNTVLEAMKTNNAIVALNIGESDRNFEDVCLLVDCHDISYNLSQILYKLLKSPGKIDEYKKLSLNYAKKNIINWTSRIEYEIGLIKSIAG